MLLLMGYLLLCLYSSITSSIITLSLILMMLERSTSVIIVHSTYVCVHYVYIKIYLMWREFFSTGDTCGTSSNIVRVIAHLKQTALTQHDMCPGYAQVSGTDLISLVVLLWSLSQVASLAQSTTSMSRMPTDPTRQSLTCHPTALPVLSSMV